MTNVHADGMIGGTIGKFRIEIVLVFAGIIVLVAYAIVQRSLLGDNVSTDLHIIGVPLDDVYVHCQFAKNVLRGIGYSFNPGFIVSSDTSPLWVMLLAIGGIFFSRIELVAVGISMLSYLTLGPGVYRASRDIFGLRQGHAILAGLLAVLASRLVWSGMSGMETALATLLMLLIAEEHIRSKRRNCLRPREAIWLGLGLLLRPEFLFVAIVCAGDWIIARFRFKADLTTLWMTLLVGAAICSPAFLLPLVTHGSPVSHSSIVQGASASAVPNVKYLWIAMKIIASNNVVIFVLLVAGFYFLHQRKSIWFLYFLAIGLPFVQAFVAPQFRHHGRYFFPILPLVIIIGLISWEEIKANVNLSPIVTKAIIGFLIMSGLVESGRWAMIEGESVRNINDQHLAVVDWLRHNMGSKDTLAVDDVGAIGYFLNRPVIDLTGLMTPQLWPLQHNQDSVWRVSRTMGANLFVIYDRLNPPFYNDHKDSLTLQASFRVRPPLASSADTVMNIYRVKGSWQ